MVRTAAILILLATVVNGQITIDGTNSLIYGGVIPSESRYTTRLPGRVTRTSSAKFSDVDSVKDVGAFGDNSHDDTAALQQAFDNAKNINGVIYLPCGIYKISSSLLLTGSGIKIYGCQMTAALPNSGSEIRGNGTFPLITIQGPTPGQFVFRYEISNLRLNTSATLDGSNNYSFTSEAAIKIVNLSEATFDHIMIGDTFGGYHKFTSGIYCDNCSNVHISYVTPTSCIYGYNLDNASQIFFEGGSPSANTYHFHLGVVDYIVIRDNWMEWAQSAILIDPNNSKGFARVTNFTMESTRMINGPTSPYANADCIHVDDNSGATTTTVYNFTIGAGSSCRVEVTSTGLFTVDLGSAGSSIVAAINDTLWLGPGPAVITSNNGNTHIRASMNKYLHADATALLPFLQVSGSGSVFVDDNFTGSFWQHSYIGASQEQVLGSHSVTGTPPQYTLFGTTGTATLSFFKNGSGGGQTAFIGQPTAGNNGLDVTSTGDIFMIPGSSFATWFAGSGFYGSLGVFFSALGSAANGTETWCKDCTVGATKDSVCTDSGTGAKAIKTPAGWKCPF